MDKFEMELYTQVREHIADLQSCFIDFNDETYARTPSPSEWRRASRLVHKLNLLCLELYGYANACRQYNVVSIRERLSIVPGSDKEKPDVGTSGQEVEQGFVLFTEQEIRQMPSHFRKLIIINKQRCRMRVHVSGKNTTTYEIRLRAGGYNLCACGKTIELAKANMLKKLKDTPPNRSDSSPTSIPTSFHSFAVYYYETFRKPKIASRTYKCDWHRYVKYLQPYFSERPIKLITPSDCKKLLDEVMKTGKGKTAEELYSIMSILFKGAIAHGIIDKNPLDIVLKPTYEQVNGCALTLEEQAELFANLSEPDFIVAVALALYCGLRPNEIATATVDGDFIKSVNSKRKNGKVEYKKIPICNNLRKYIRTYIDVGLPVLPTPQLIRRRVKDALPSHKLYDLRTTFYSRCKELGVADVALKHFAGHALDKLESAYTDLSDTYLLKEGKKLNDW